MDCCMSGSPVLHHLPEYNDSEVAQSCPTLCDPMDYNLPHPSVRGVFQARVLEWAAISFSRRSSRPRDQTWVSLIVGRRLTVLATREVPEYTQTYMHWVSDVTNHLIYYCPLLLLPSILPSTGAFPVSWLFTSGGQSIGASALASVLLLNIQDWLPLGLTGLISLQSKGLSRVFSNTPVQKYQFSGAQPSLWSEVYSKPLSPASIRIGSTILYLIRYPYILYLIWKLEGGMETNAK